MKIKTVEIVIVMVVLFLLAACFGCKDKVKANEANEANELVTLRFKEPIVEWPPSVPTSHTDVMFTYHNEELTLNIINDEIVSNQPAEKAIEIIFKSLYVGYDIGADSDVNGLSFRFKEPNEPIESIHISMMSDDGEGFSKYYTGTESEIRKALIKDGVIAEPNEPKIQSSNLLFEWPKEPKDWPFKVIIPELSPMEYEPFTCITQFIPTWPDYIELEKDLVIEMPKSEDYPIVTRPPMLIPKGTKIYFSDKD